MISVTLTNDYAYDKLSDLGLCVFTGIHYKKKHSISYSLYEFHGVYNVYLLFLSLYVGNLKRLKKLLKKNGINTKFTVRN